MLSEHSPCFHLTGPNKVILVWKSRDANGCLEETCGGNNCHGDEFVYRKRPALARLSSPPSLSASETLIIPPSLALGLYFCILIIRDIRNEFQNSVVPAGALSDLSVDGKLWLFGFTWKSHRPNAIVRRDRMHQGTTFSFL